MAKAGPPRGSTPRSDRTLSPASLEAGSSAPRSEACNPDSVTEGRRFPLDELPRDAALRLALELLGDSDVIAAAVRCPVCDLGDENRSCLCNERCDALDEIIRALEEELEELPERERVSREDLTVLVRDARSSAEAEHGGSTCEELDSARSSSDPSGSAGSSSAGELASDSLASGSTDSASSSSSNDSSSASPGRSTPAPVLSLLPPSSSSSSPPPSRDPSLVSSSDGLAQASELAGAVPLSVRVEPLARDLADRIQRAIGMRLLIAAPAIILLDLRPAQRIAELLEHLQKLRLEEPIR